MTAEPLKVLAAGATLALLLVLGGCADQSSPDNVDQRAVERWNYLITHQAEKAYDYLTPGFRATQTREDYASAMNNRPVQWKEVKFNRKKCDADRCEVYVDVGFAMKMPGAGKMVSSTSTQSETWVRVGDGWYFLPK